MGIRSDKIGPAPTKSAHDFTWFRVRWMRGYGWILDRPPAVVVVPIAPDGRVWLAETKRRPTRTKSWECPGGAIDAHEEIVEAGLRELEEECGLYPRGRVRVHPSPLELAPGMGRFPHHIVIAHDVVPRGATALCQLEEGIVRVRRFTRTKVQAMIGRGSINVHATLAALAVAGWLSGKGR